MKKILTTTIIGAALSVSASATTTVLENFQFNEAATTALNSLSLINTGSNNTAWNFALGNPDEGYTNGLGGFVIGGDATAGSAAISKDYTRKLTFATSVTSGTYVFEYRLNSWDLTATAALTPSEHGQEGIQFKLSNSGASINLFSALNGSSSNSRARHSASNGASATAEQSNIGLTGSDLIVRVAGDLVTGNFTTSYNLGGSGFNTLISDGSGMTSIDEVQLIVEGGNGWAANDTVNIDYMTLTVTAVPEPSSTALLGLGGLALILRRRK